MFTLVLAASIGAPNPARHEKPTAEGLQVLLRPAAGAAPARPDPGLTPASTLVGTEFPVLREEAGRVMIRHKGADVWVSRAEIMTPAEAVRYFTELLATDAQPNNLTRRAKAYELLADWDAAIKDYDEAIKASPQMSAYWNNRANYYSRKREYDKALTGYDEAIRLSPGSYIPMGNRGNTFLNRREWDKAIEAYDQAIKTNPNYARAYAGRSSAWREKRDHDKALGDAQRAVEVDPTSPHTLQARGLARLAMKEYDRALADFEEALRYDPLFAAGYSGRGSVYLARKAYQPAIRDLDTAIRLWSGNAAALTRRAEAWAACGNPRKALTDLTEAVAMDDRYGPAYRARAWLLATHPDDSVRDGKAAVAAARKAVELTPQPGGETWEALAAALAESGDFDAAVEAQRKAVADSGYVKDKGDGVGKRLELYEAKKAYRE